MYSWRHILFSGTIRLNRGLETLVLMNRFNKTESAVVLSISGDYFDVLSEYNSHEISNLISLLKAACVKYMFCILCIVVK